MRLIDANALKTEFNLNFGGVSHAVAAGRIIDAAPTIDPIRHGYWIDNGTHDTCSICGESFGKYDEYDYRQDFDFCPMCGSKMDGVRQCD